jgi:hypothetical protein
MSFGMKRLTSQRIGELIIRRMVLGEVARPCQSHLAAPSVFPSPLRRRCRLPNLPSFPLFTGGGRWIVNYSVKCQSSRWRVNPHAKLLVSKPPALVAVASLIQTTPFI